MELIGQIIGNYQIEALLGTGGMGQVFRARHLQLHRAAAFKVLHPQYASDPTFQARFVQEARTIASMIHPNIIEIYDFGQHDDWYYLIMELVGDGSLRTLLQQQTDEQSTLPLWLGLDLVRQAADGLAFAHAKSMVHRDIKPDNLLLTRGAVVNDFGDPYLVKVSDFGLAKLAEGGMQTVQGQTMGTPAYMSPEQCQALALDGRSDIYSLGIVLYEIATGVVPFETKGLSDAVYKHIYAEPPPPRQVRPDLSPELQEVILHCLKKAPSERFSTAAELSRELSSLVRSLRAGVAGAQTIVPSLEPVRPSDLSAKSSDFRIAFERERQTLTPGESEMVRVSILSQDRGPQEIDLDLEAIPAAWLPASSATVSLPPGTGQVISLPVTVPRSFETPAGEYPVTVRASSAATGSAPVTASAIWVVAPYDAITLEVTPVQASGWTSGVYTATVKNLGNVPARVELGGQSDASTLALKPNPAVLELAPGEAQSARITARVVTRWGGGRSITANVEARGNGDARQTVPVTFAQRALLPFLLPVFGLLLIAVVVGGFLLTRGNGSANGTLGPTPTATSASSAVAVAAASTTPTPTTAAASTADAPTPTVSAASTTAPTHAPSAGSTAAVVVPPVTPSAASHLPFFVFSTGRGKPPGVLEVYRMNADGSGLAALTQNDQDDWEPAVSADETQVAFVSTRDGHNQIYVMNADGSDQRRLTNDPASDEYPIWSPAEPRIVFTRSANQRTALYLINADGSNLTELATTTTGSNWSPDWSPDGKQIVFVSDRFGKPDIFSINVDGTNLHQLTSSDSDDSPRWSYDGEHIVFLSRRDGNAEIYVMNADGSSQTRLTDTPVDEMDPSWSPDDGRIAFAAGGEIFTMHADGTQRVQLTHGAVYDSWLRWSPGQEYLVFTSNRDGNREIYVMNQDGSGLKRLTNNAGFDGNPTWAPFIP
ncbi:MAG TPA: protein kinase [Nitrolancea sp.]|jgi:Tol biopolymer transport system component/serine/threonine protein kinase|nr:protein kinase [Nitrolancea sp.]